MSTADEERIVLMEMHADKVEQIRQLQAACAEKDAELNVLAKYMDGLNEMALAETQRANAAEARATAAEQERADLRIYADNKDAELARAYAGWADDQAKLAAAERREAELRKIATEFYYGRATSDAMRAALSSPSTPSPRVLDGDASAGEHYLWTVKERPSTPSPAPSAEGEPERRRGRNRLVARSGRIQIEPTPPGPASEPKEPA